MLLPQVYAASNQGESQRSDSGFANCYLADLTDGVSLSLAILSYQSLHNILAKLEDELENSHEDNRSLGEIKT